MIMRELFIFLKDVFDIELTTFQRGFIEKSKGKRIVISHSRNDRRKRIME